MGSMGSGRAVGAAGSESGSESRTQRGTSRAGRATRSAWIGLASLGVASLGLAVGCDDGDVEVDGGGRDAGPVVTDAGPPGAVPSDYVFDSRFSPGTSSVNHGGQAARHVLLEDMEGYVEGLTLAIDSGDPPFADGVEAGEVTAGLEYFFSVPGADRVDDPIRFTTDPPLAQATYGDVSGSAFLLEKLAGNDTSTDFRDWSTDFVGWNDASVFAAGADVSNPTGLVRAMFATLDAAGVARGAGSPAMSPVASPEALPVHVTPEGIDLAELLKKFLLGALAFHQAADDYTDDDVADKGLRADNTAADGDAPYTSLEHAWDEAYGYFGAAASYNRQTAAELAAGPPYVDRDMDGAIDLTSEMNFGVSVYAAQRDNGAMVATDFMGTAGDAFRRGRHIISTAGGALDTDQQAALVVERDRAIGAWEAAMAATVIHYLNDTLQVMADFETPAYDHARFLDHAKAWSEMKGFALAFQFNPRSPLSQADFAMLHTLLGDRPVLEADGATAAADYRVALRDARALLAARYGFDAANLGDDDGNGGW